MSKTPTLSRGIQLEGCASWATRTAFAKAYYEQGIDELLYIDIVASLYNRNNLSDIVCKTVDDVYIPVCVGGGLRSVEDVRHILSMGADKVAINTAAIKRPALITEVAEAFGSQCMVLSIQAKRSRTWPGKWEAYYDNGRAHPATMWSSGPSAVWRWAQARSCSPAWTVRGCSRAWIWSLSRP